MTDHTEDDLSEDAWWLRYGRKPVHPRNNAPPTPSPDEEIVGSAPKIEDEVPEPGGDDEIWLFDDDSETVATWSALDNTITLRANEARSRIAGIANAVRETGHAG